MAANQKSIYVYDDFSFDEPILLGLLYITFIRGKENFSFEYDHQWLVRTMFPVDLDPEIPGFAGRHYPGGKGIFGIFSDASPDRWGRVLMNKLRRDNYGLQNFRQSMMRTIMEHGKRWCMILPGCVD